MANIPQLEYIMAGRASFPYQDYMIRTAIMSARDQFKRQRHVRDNSHPHMRSAAPCAVQSG